MAKSIDHGLKKISEVCDQGDLMCELNRTTILTRQNTDDGGQSYGKINIVKGSQWNPVKIPSNVHLEKCALLGTDQFVGVVDGKKLTVYDTRGKHLRTIDVEKNGRVKTVENISAVAVITTKILVAESQRYQNLIHVVDYNTGVANESLSIDQKIIGLIPIRTGLVLVRLKEEIQAVDYSDYPRVDITEVIAYGRTLVNMCVKGGNDELYVMFVKGVNPKILEIHVLDEKNQELHREKITHTTPILSLKAAYTSPGPGYLVIQIGTTLFTFKCSFGHQKGPAKESELKIPAKKNFYSERRLPPRSASRPITPVPKAQTENAGKEKSESHTEKDKDENELSESSSSACQLGHSELGPVLVDSKNTSTDGKQDTRRKSTTDVGVSKKIERSGITARLKKAKPAVLRRTISAPLIQVGQLVKNTSEQVEATCAEKDQIKGKPSTASDATEEDKKEQEICQPNIHESANSQNTTSFESGYIGEEGGIIQSNKYGFSLHVPPGAIAKGQRKKIRVGLCRETHATAGAPAGGVSISPLICAEPSGLELEKPARINLQHCLSSWSNDAKISVHELVNDSDGGRSSCEDMNKDVKCFIGKNGQLTLEISRLGTYALTVEGSEVYKKLVCRPFIPKLMPTTKKPIINVLIYDLTDGMKKMMMEEIGNESPYPVIPAHIGKNFILNLSGKDAQEIHLTCSSIDSMEVKSLTASELVEFKSNSVDFQIDCSDGQSQDITVELSFANKKIDMICHVDIPFVPQDQQNSPLPSPSTDTEYCSSRKSSTSFDVEEQNDVPSQVLHEIAGEVPHTNYIPLGLKLGLEKAKLDSILVGCANDSEEAMYRALEAWKNRVGVDNRGKLKEILISGDLKRIAEKYLN